MSDRLDQLEEQADQISDSLPDEALNQQDSDSAVNVSIDRRLPLFKINGEQVEKSKSWDEIRR